MSGSSALNQITRRVALALAGVGVASIPPVGTASARGIDRFQLIGIDAPADGAVSMSRQACARSRDRSQGLIIFERGPQILFTRAGTDGPGDPSGLGPQRWARKLRPPTPG